MENNTENQYMVFPIKGAEECPTCKCKEGIGRQYIDELKSDGRIGPKAYPDGLQVQIAMTEVLQTKLITIKPVMPILCMSFEICAECFTWYCTKVNLMQQPVKIQVQPGQGQPPVSPFFGKG